MLGSRHARWRTGPRGDSTVEAEEGSSGPPCTAFVVLLLVCGSAALSCSNAPTAPATPSSLEEHGASQETVTEVQQTWERFRELLLEDERDPAAYEELIDKPDGFGYLQRCLADGADLIVEWLRMKREELQSVDAEFRFFVDRGECEVHFSGLDDRTPPVLLIRLVEGHWVIWPQRG